MSRRITRSVTLGIGRSMPIVPRIGTIGTIEGRRLAGKTSSEAKILTRADTGALRFALGSQRLIRQESGTGDDCSVAIEICDGVRAGSAMN